ncbi:MAG: asparagine synthase (glutamine-hydrolyzing) [Flavobacteriaceae bacterium]|nr:asparagine synthase (glutamine-hydrolyzing) [Flavobacteriaceae bacterium]
MCGILGYYGNNEKSFLKKTSLDNISHRGPDFSDYLSNESFYLGHTRLSILDLSPNGNQPMISKDGKFVIIFNGEIYNHLDLREEHLNKIDFISTSDTETLLYGLIKIGADFVNKLNGIFAFSFYNIEKKEFIIVRDHFGVKPLYYHLNDNEICFSSESKALMSYLPKVTVNEAAIKNYLNFLWSPGELTPVHEIKKLLPGHMIVGTSDNLKSLKITQYYQIPFDDASIENKSEKYFIDALEVKLIEAVRKQMLADVPVGFFLSGGLDSSLIVAIARKLFPEKEIQCYTIKSPDVSKEGFADDLNYAKKVAEYLNVNLTIVDANSDILEFFDKIVYHLDEPQADPAPINVYKICKEAKKNGIKVLLGGTAGDDLFSGYRRHQALQLESIFSRLPLFFRKILKNMVSGLNKQKPLNRRLNKLFRNIDQSKLNRMLGYFDWIDSKNLNELFLEENNFDHHLYFKNLTKSLPEKTSDLNKMLFWELNTFLVDHNLNYTDKLSMATGVEVRVPFLDKELVEFSTKIPIGLKLKGKETKYILKKVGERYLPNEVIYRPKTGFGAPVRQWILNDMSSMIDTYLSKETIEKRKIFDYNKVQELIEKNKKGVEDFSYTIWALLAIESWMIQFYDKKQ